jgi:hypothetical protein
MPAATQTRIRAPGLPAPTPQDLRRGSHASPEIAAVLALQRKAGNRATRALMRQPTKTVPAPWPTEDAGPGPVQPPTIVSAEPDGDTVTVRMSDGTRWLVTRKRSTVPIVKKRGTFGVGFGADSDRIWMKASWCRGTRGEIRVGGNPQGAAKDVLKNLAQGIANGGDADDVKRIITAAEIQPFIDWDIQRPGDWKITGEVKLTFDKGGLKTAGGKVSVAKGPFEGGIEGEGDREGSWNVTVTGKWTPGGKTKTKDECPADELLFPYEYECVRERDIPATTKPVKKTADDPYPEHRFIYFKYASDEVNKKLTPDSEIQALGDLMARDYKVVNIQAFTSPEGLRDPSPRWKEGNKALGMRRAEKAKEIASAACTSGSCITGGITPPKDVELLHQDWENLDGTTSEKTGKMLEEDVIADWEAGVSDDIKEQKTPAADKRVKAASGRHAKAGVIYEYLRRSRIDLLRVEHREWIDQEPVPARTDRRSGNCPEDVLTAARQRWKLDDSLK